MAYVVRVDKDGKVIDRYYTTLRKMKKPPAKSKGNNYEKQPFYPEYMTKKRPHVPRCLCRTTLDWLLGRMSPSLVFMAWADEEKHKKHMDFEEQFRKYNCWKRRLSKWEWKYLYRQYRLQQQYGVQKR